MNKVMYLVSYVYEDNSKDVFSNHICNVDDGINGRELINELRDIIMNWHKKELGRTLKLIPTIISFQKI